MKKSLFILFISCSLLSWSQNKELTTAEVKAFKTRVKKETATIKSIRTDFIQQKHMDFLSNDIESKGKMFLRENGDLRWEYTSPNQYSIIFKDNKVLINDDGKKSSVDGGSKMFKKINQLISKSVSGNIFDDTDFELAFFQVKNGIQVHIVPTNATVEKYIKQIYLTFPNQESTVSRVKLIEPSGDYTLINFVNKELNVPLDESIFSH